MVAVPETAARLLVEPRTLVQRAFLFLNQQVMNTNAQPEQQPTSYGLQEVLNTTTCHDNAKGITLSNETRTLIECRARLSDVYSDVIDTMDAYWGGGQVDRITEQFCNAYSDLDFALLGLLGEMMADIMLTDSFKKM